MSYDGCARYKGHAVELGERQGNSLRLQGLRARGRGQPLPASLTSRAAGLRERGGSGAAWEHEGIALVLGPGRQPLRPLDRQGEVSPPVGTGARSRSGRCAGLRGAISHRLGGTPPHLDISISRSNDEVGAVEGKFTEHLGRATRGKSEFSESYFPRGSELWAERGLPACQELAQELRSEERRGGRQRFEHLDPRQLLKHALGLATQRRGRFCLIYLYYDWTGERPEAHRREVDIFGERVGDETRFRAITYQSVFGRLRDSGRADEGYMEYLADRYFARMG